MSPVDEPQAQPVVPATVFPNFPTGSLGTSQETLRNAYLWAKFMIEAWGNAAPTKVQMAMMDSLRQNDIASFQGWNNISIAMADFARLPGMGETVH